MKINVEPFNLISKSSSNYPPLSYQVADSLHHYFENLDGVTPVNLYELVLVEVEIPLLKMVLNKCKGNESKTAKLLGISRGTLRKKIKHYHLKD